MPSSDSPAEPVPVLALLASLVAIDSTSGSVGEEDSLVAVAAWFDGCAAAVATVHRSASGYAQCVTVLPSHPDDALASTVPLLLFAAHIDVVPVTRPEDWAHDPFGAEIDGGRMYGRGTSDMKSGLAAAMIAVRDLLMGGAPVALAVSRGEEIGCRGAADVAHALESVPIGGVIIPESTANSVVLGHRGALWLSVATAGVAAHGSTPERGDNAILAMARLLGRLDEVPLGEHPDLGAETVNVGTITGGTVPNIVPDACTVELDMRLARTAPDVLVQWWRDQPEVVSVEVDLQLDAVWTNPATPWLATLGAPVSPSPAAYYTDASVLVATLPAGTPVVVWGPGDPSTVHSVEESVPVAAVTDAVRLYRAAGESWARAAR
jgi:succinyl-diaminopimelate desuccinylase